jgi:hypothetical protein
VFTDGDTVRGISVRCRRFGVIGATDTFSVFDQPLMGDPVGTSRMLECDSGQAITGLRVRSGLVIDALGISCHVVAPSFSTIVNFVADSLFLNGRGSVVNAGASSTVTGLVGGTGGTAASFECASGTPFIRALQVAESDRVWGLRASCSRVLNKPLDPAASTADLAARTVSQVRVITAGATDSFRVEVFNLGGRVEDAEAAYVDVIFSSRDVQFTGVPGNCDAVSTNRFRCSLPNIENVIEGLSVSVGTFFALFPNPRPEAPIVVVQASYDVEDSDFSNNTYGFAVTVR